MVDKDICPLNSAIETLALVLQDALRGVPLRQGLSAGTILFRVGAIDETPLLVSLSPTGCDARSDVTGADVADPDLTVYADEAQLEELLMSGSSSAPLTVHGREELLASLAAMLAPGDSPIATRIAMMKKR